MGRRSRRRSSTTPELQSPTAPAARTARVRVDDATWAEFKQAIGDRSVAETLGRYVELEVARARRARADEDHISQRELLDALERAQLTAEALQQVTRRLEVLARRPT